MKFLPSFSYHISNHYHLAISPTPYYHRNSMLPLKCFQNYINFIIVHLRWNSLPLKIAQTIAIFPKLLKNTKHQQMYIPLLCMNITPMKTLYIFLYTPAGGIKTFDVYFSFESFHYNIGLTFFTFSSLLFPLSAKYSY